MNRRSTTRSVPRKRYTADAFEGIAELQDDSDSGLERIDLDPEASAEDFDLTAEHPNPASEDDEMSGPEGAPGSPSSSPAASDAGERLLDDTISIADSDLDTPAKAGSGSTSKPPRVAFNTFRPTRRSFKPAPSIGPQTYTRGLNDALSTATNNDQKRRLLFGSAVEDARAAYAAKGRWAGMPCLPGRVGDGAGRRAEEEKRAWDARGGMDACFARQIFSTIGEDEARDYLPEGEGSECSFLMGPYSNQHLYKLAVGKSMRLMDAWGDDGPRKQGRPKIIRSNYKNGFMINLGARVHCLEWAPHQHGQSQYLAVSMLPKRQSDHPPFQAPEAPAFTPQPPHKASIQIWKLKRRQDGTIDTEAGCKLAAVLCTDWGDVKEFKYCPMPIAKSEPSSNTIDLGLLAVLHGDGTVRVLRLNAIPQTSNTTHIHITHPAFSSRPPNTICTCLAWLSSTRIAAGCANGSLAIWDLPSSTPSTSPKPRTFIYSSISTTYILSLTPCAPSHPHFLLTLPATGHTLLTDLSRPAQILGSTVSSSRVRIAQRGLAWHPFLQLAVHLEDNFVKGSPLRRMFASTTLARARGSVTALAVSGCHPCVLVGSAGGEVVAVNPVEKVLEMKGRSWVLRWFGHEWRRGSGGDGGGSGGMEVDSGGGGHDPVSVGGDGVSRITEGFKIEHNYLSKEDRRKRKQRDTVPVMTVHEGKSAVSALAWNTNVEVGGWAAAGMGDGLLRIEDIAT